MFDSWCLIKTTNSAKRICVTIQDVSYANLILLYAKQRGLFYRKDAKALKIYEKHFIIISY